jgi:hypothetical protein
MHPHHPDREDAGHGKSCPVSKQMEKDSGVTTVRTLKHLFGAPMAPARSPRTPPQESCSTAEGLNSNFEKQLATSPMHSKAEGEGEGTSKAFELPARLPASPLLAQKVLLQSAMDRMVRGFEADVGGFIESADTPTIARMESPPRPPPKQPSPSRLLRRGTVWTTQNPSSKADAKGHE